MEIINKTIYDGGVFLYNKFDSEFGVLVKKIKIKNKKCFVVIPREKYNSNLLKFINRVDGFNMFYRNSFGDFYIKDVNKNHSYYNAYLYKYMFTYVTKVTIGQLELTLEQAHENFKDKKQYSKLFKKITIDNNRITEFMEKDKESYIYISEYEIL